MNQLELHDRAGRLIRSVAAIQNAHDATKWHLAEAAALAANQIESAVLCFGDGTSHAVEPSLFPTSVRINTLFIAVPTVLNADDPDEPVNSLFPFRASGPSGRRKGKPSGLGAVRGVLSRSGV